MRILPKLLLTVVGTSVVAGVFSSTAAFFRTKETLEATVKDTQLAYAIQTLDKIDRFLYERYNDIQSIAGQDTIQSFLKSAVERDPEPSAHLRRRMSDQLVQTGPWEDLAIVDLNGIVIYATDESHIGESVYAVKEDGEAFRRAIVGEVSYSDALFDERLGRVTSVFAAPVHDDLRLENVTGAVIGHISWPSILDLLRSPRGRRLTLYDQTGKVIADSYHLYAIRPLTNDTSATAPVRDALAGKDNVSVGFDPVTQEGALTAAVSEKGYFTYRGNGWALLVQLPARTAFGPAQDVAIDTANLLGLITLVAAALAFFYIRRIVSPIKQLTQSIRRFGKDGRAASEGLIMPKSVLTSGDEVAELAASFNDMAARLAASYGLLERKVRQRTLELQKKMEELASINRLMVGREIRMSELKRELDEITRKLLKK